MRVDKDLTVPGTLTVGNITLPANVVGDTEFNGSDPLSCAKQSHQFLKDYKQNKTTTVAADRQFLHMAFGDGDMVGFRACLIDTVNLSGATITVKIYKNGVDITGTASIITDAHALYEVVEGTLSSLPYSADDVFEVVVTVAAGGGTLGKGLCVTAIFREDAE